MTLLDVLQNMEIVDILRSGALLVAFLSILVGNRTERNAVGNWIYVDALSTGAFGLGWLLFPDSLLGYMVAGKLDPIHLLLTRFFGAALLAWGVMTYQSLDPSNRGQWPQNLLTKSMVLSVLLLAMLVVQMKSQPDGKQKFNEHHLTFGILGGVLLLAGNVLSLMRCPDLGTYQTRPLSLRNCANACAALDMFLCLSVFTIYFAFPSYALSYVQVEKFKMDLVHLHMTRAVAVLLLGSALGYMAAFITGSSRARHAEVTRRVLMGGLMLPMIIAAQWWYQPTQPGTFAYIQSINIVVYLNICWAYFLGRKE